MRNRWKQILGVTLLISGLALGGVGLWLLMSPSKYVATVRIRMESDVTDSYPPGTVVYDPYFIQTTFEVIQSQLVLSNVITKLNLNQVWGEKYFGGRPLKLTETIAILKNRMSLAPIRNTKLVAITFYSDNPNEAAQIANAIAEAYIDYRAKSRRELTTQGLDILQQQFRDQEKQIAVLQNQVAVLRQQFGIPDPAPTNQLPEQQTFWDEKRKLDQLIKLHHLLWIKIETEKVDLQIPKTSMVQITDPAEPPKNPVSPNRFLGTVLLALGLISTVTGFLLLKSGRQQNV
jgi:uncharacterized protein involved in exopolysaccharide biosynthesis